MQLRFKMLLRRSIQALHFTAILTQVEGLLESNKYLFYFVHLKSHMK